MTETNYQNARHLITSVMTHIPEGLELPYFQNPQTEGQHVLAILPDAAQNTCWWVTTGNLAKTVDQLKKNIQDVPSDTNEVQQYALSNLKEGKAKLFLWKVHSSVALKSFRACFDKWNVAKKRREQHRGVAMETWAVRLKEHPEFTCLFTVNPSRHLDAHKAAIAQTIRIWRRFSKDETAQDPIKQKAHVHYARRNKLKLSLAENYVAEKIASYSTHDVYRRHRLIPYNGWVTPSKVIESSMEFKHYTGSGAKSTSIAEEPCLA